MPKNSFLNTLYNNHVLANLLFVLILITGFNIYNTLPREQDPSINFNWIQIITKLPGASASDVEALVTDKLENAIQNISDLKFVSSISRESLSSILVRFENIDDTTFDKRINDLRREVQNKEDELPVDASSPRIIEITSANSYPTATILVVGDVHNEVLRKNAYLIKKDLERFTNIDTVEAYGLEDPELQVLFSPEKLLKFNISPNQLEASLHAHFQDLPAGTAKISKQQWLIRWLGKNPDPNYISKLPIINNSNELLFGNVSNNRRYHEKSSKLVSFNNKAAIMLSITKQAKSNTLELVEEINAYTKQYNNKNNNISMVVLDDQTIETKKAISIMQTNALYGLMLVLFTSWLFLGIRIASLVAIGIPFTLAATFILLKYTGNTLNISVLLGIVICLGMLVDDSVVIVEAIYFRLSQGMEKMTAILESLSEVATPVLTSVLTTAAAFVPLMLLPGILGKFMLVIPVVVTSALLLSLIEAFWMLPAHISAVKISFDHNSKIQMLRNQITNLLRVKYTKLLIKSLRNPKKALTMLLVLIIFAFTILKFNFIHIEFFAGDTKRNFYVNIEMPNGTSLEDTLAQVKTIDAKIKKFLQPEELHATAGYSGIMFSQMAPRNGDHYGQIAVTLNPQKRNMRHVSKVIDAMREEILSTPGPENIAFLMLKSGPPLKKPIQVKVRGDNYIHLRNAVKDVKQILATIEPISDINTDDYSGSNELVLKPNLDAITRANISPAEIINIIRLNVDGKVINSFQDAGEKVNVRLQAKQLNNASIDDILNQNVLLSTGEKLPLKELVYYSTGNSSGNIRHYNFKRTITISADLDKSTMNIVDANKLIKQKWQKIAEQHDHIDLEFSGELDDIQESLDSMPALFLLGLGIIYLILGTQFRSYLQPLIVLSTVPLAFLGVIIGLFISANPLSLYTLYGVVALSGITVNSAIVLISAANQRLAAGMSVNQAVVYAAKRRLIPILITSLTTISGLLSLAIGLGGKSLMWGPVATAIVWGLLVATSMTLIFIPILYRFSVRGRATASQLRN